MHFPTPNVCYLPRHQEDPIRIRTNPSVDYRMPYSLRAPPLVLLPQNDPGRDLEHAHHQTENTLIVVAVRVLHPRIDLDHRLHGPAAHDHFRHASTTTRNIGSTVVDARHKPRTSTPSCHRPRRKPPRHSSRSCLNTNPWRLSTIK